MAKAAAKPQPIDRARIAREIVDLSTSIAPTVAKIDALKDQLRTVSDELGAGFTEEVAGKGSVEVKAATTRSFKGTLPKLVAETFLALKDASRRKLIDDGLVVEEQQWTRPSKASVTVRLA